MDNTASLNKVIEKTSTKASVKQKSLVLDKKELSSLTNVSIEKKSKDASAANQGANLRRSKTELNTPKPKTPISNEIKREPVKSAKPLKTLNTIQPKQQQTVSTSLEVRSASNLRQTKSQINPRDNFGRHKTFVNPVKSKNIQETKRL
jgi:hypothetical protein